MTTTPNDAATGRPPVVDLATWQAARDEGAWGSPDLPLWERGYAAEARRAYLTAARTLPEALAHVRPYLDPVLDRSATGSWDPRRAAGPRSAVGGGDIAM